MWGTCEYGQLDDSTVSSLRKTFEAIDSSGDGFVTLREFKDSIQKARVKVPKDFQTMLESVDTDENGQIDWREFLAATMERHYYSKEQS